MSLPATLPQAILDATLNRLALFFLTGAANDMILARNAVRQLLADYNPETAQELNLAAEIITLQMHALEALSDAANPDLSPNKILRLRGCAVSLSREQHKAHRKLDQIQKARRSGLQPPADEPVAINPKAEKAIAVIQAQRQPEPAKIPPLKSLHKYQAARIITENLKKQQAQHAAQTAAIAAATTGQYPPALNSASQSCA